MVGGRERGGERAAPGGTKNASPDTKRRKRASGTAFVVPAVAAVAAVAAAAATDPTRQREETT